MSGIKLFDFQHKALEAITPCVTERMIAYTEALLFHGGITDPEARERILRINDYLCTRANRDG